MVATGRFCLDKNAFDAVHCWRDTFHARSLDSAVLNSEPSLSTVIIAKSRIGGGSGCLAGLLYLNKNAKRTIY